MRDIGRSGGEGVRGEIVIVRRVMRRGVDAAIKGQRHAKGVHYRVSATCGGGADQSMGTAVGFGKYIKWRRQETWQRLITHVDKQRR